MDDFTMGCPVCGSYNCTMTHHTIPVLKEAPRPDNPSRDWETLFQQCFTEREKFANAVIEKSKRISEATAVLKNERDNWEKRCGVAVKDAKESWEGWQASLAAYGECFKLCMELAKQNALLLDMAVNLRETVKDLYNASCFDSTIAPEGMLEMFRKAVKEATDKVLHETIEVSRLQHTAELEGLPPEP